MKLKKLFLLVWMFGVVFAAQAADGVKGSGTLETRGKEIADYNSIRIDGAYEIHYEQSNLDPFLEITVDDNLQQYIDVEIKERTLYIRFKGVKVDHFTKFIIKTTSNWLREVRIAGNANFMIDSPLTGDETSIKAKDNSLIQFKEPVALGKLNLDVSGSANMVVEDLHADRLECTINGSGSITLKNGKAKEGAYSITSNGDIHAFGMEVSELKCSVTGSGTAEVHVTDNLKATLVGKGNIRYKGSTAVQMKKIGKGTIEEVK